MQALSHYHRVETALWYDVSAILQGVVLSYFDPSRRNPLAQVTRHHCACLVDFLDEMEHAYVHPRRDSRRVRLSASRRASAQIHPANP